MAKFNQSYKKLMYLEYSSRPDLFLHKNKNETGYTLGGVYQLYNANSIDWAFIDRVVKLCDNDIKRASSILYRDKLLHNEVYEVFKIKYWDKYNLESIRHQNTADEIIIACVNFGRKAIKYAQQIVGVKDDGVIGAKTIEALNNFNPDLFSKLYDKKEIEHYERLVEKNDKFAINLAGWRNRALFT